MLLGCVTCPGLASAHGVSTITAVIRPMPGTTSNGELGRLSAIAVHRWQHHSMCAGHRARRLGRPGPGRHHHRHFQAAQPGALLPPAAGERGWPGQFQRVPGRDARAAAAAGRGRPSGGRRRPARHQRWPGHPGQLRLRATQRRREFHGWRQPQSHGRKPAGTAGRGGIVRSGACLQQHATFLKNITTPNHVARPESGACRAGLPARRSVRRLQRQQPDGVRRPHVSRAVRARGARQQHELGAPGLAATGVEPHVDGSAERAAGASSRSSPGTTTSSTWARRRSR